MRCVAHLYLFGFVWCLCQRLAVAVAVARGVGFVKCAEQVAGSKRPIEIPRSQSEMRGRADTVMGDGIKISHVMVGQAVPLHTVSSVQYLCL